MQPSLSWLTAPEIFRVNQLPAHSDHVCYASKAEAASGVSSLRQSLDGAWKFCYAPGHAQRPAEFWREDFDVSGWGTIQVPGHIELQGYGQIQYINTLYPWDGVHALRPPQIDPDDAPVGSYVTFFDLPAAWRGQRVCVSFGGAETALYVWCNGQFVGYAEDSFTPSDFDLTPYLREKGNRLCAEVHKRSAASWIEDQDFFRFSGLFRSVFLYAKPAVHLEDLWLKATLAADNAAGILEPQLKLSGEVDGARVALCLTAPDGRVLYDGPAEGRIELGGVAPWSHEHPVLYTAMLTVRDAAGHVTEAVPYKIGFRRFELDGGVMKLNGQRIVFRGVNRHEWNPETGRAIGPADMQAAMQIFRQNNINAVRTCHYPDQSLWYDLCDENGIYMIDETNLESHGSWQKLGRIDPSWNVPGSLPEWRECVVDRARSMFERDKNHAAVLIWSCGNESYAGEDILAMSRFFHENDPGRLVHYEGVTHCRAFDEISDMESRMYAPPQEIRAYLESKPKKPFILCEYMHDMGNSLGGMESYVRLAEEFEQYQGGFIWDYMDQALWHFDALGRRVLGYGGDFGERPTDYAFSANGIVFADGTPKPAMQDVHYWYSSPAQRAAHDAANAVKVAQSAAQIKAEQAARAAAPSPALTVMQGDGGLGVRGQGFEILFSYPEGGPVSLVRDGVQWLYRAPRPAVWRASTENDKGNGFAARSAVWLAADALAVCTGCEVQENSAQRVKIAYTFTFSAAPGAKAVLTYTVTAAGELHVHAQYYGASNLPELPCFGVRFVTPAPVQRVEWTGLSGETYPDRCKGAEFGAHSEVPHLPAYLVPQDCGLHCGTHRAALCAQNSTGRTAARLPLEMCGEPFAFSALPYTAQELEAADHREALPASAHTVLTVYAAVRGVGGIDSWGADVEPAYHVSAQSEHAVEFLLRL